MPLQCRLIMFYIEPLPYREISLWCHSQPVALWEKSRSENTTISVIIVITILLRHAHLGIDNSDIQYLSFTFRVLTHININSSDTLMVSMVCHVKWWSKQTFRGEVSSFRLTWNGQVRTININTKDVMWYIAARFLNWSKMREGRTRTNCFGN
jgi:hypothetical protein